MDVTAHILEPSVDYPFHLTAKCYRPRNRNSVEEDGATLIVTHASGMHKECWEPVLEGLFAREGLGVREAWSVECPNHGESAALNEEALKDAWLEVFPWEEYGRAVARFLQAGPERGAKVDFSKRKLWALGHSMGAVSMAWLQQSPEYSITFDRIILVEPMLQPPGFDLRKSTSYFFPATYQRRDVWPSRQAALKDFSNNRSYKSWDPRVVDLFVRFALKRHPAARFAVAPWDGVVLACGRWHEAACYRGGGDLVSALVPKLAEMAQNIPVSIIFGAVEDSVPRKLKESLADPAISGIKFASVHWVQNAGHLVIQNSPSGVAQAVVEALGANGSASSTKSRL